jgi:hypothetical protein
MCFRAIASRSGGVLSIHFAGNPSFSDAVIARSDCDEANQKPPTPQFDHVPIHVPGSPRHFLLVVPRDDGALYSRLLFNPSLRGAKRSERRSNATRCPLSPQGRRIAFARTSARMRTRASKRTHACEETQNFTCAPSSSSQLLGIWK